MDQAAKLREYKRKRSLNVDLKIVSIVSGKGGVGKTTLVKKLYDEVGNSFIIDCDFNSFSVWNSSYFVEKGYEIKRAKSHLRDVETAIGARQYDCVFVDCGTGLNQISTYYIEKSKMTVIVTNLEEISILNTANLLKRIEGTKIVYLSEGTNFDMEELQKKINIFSEKSLNNERVMVFNDSSILGQYISKMN